ncbi:uncharacterized protein MKZ38_000246 [Zalerion maritima]|uniref:DUF5672 domain-containing protein n=1 Tax=Zalerion maritima TaxID=339359 RepID=A0AAD5RSW3_9PEZI|nr:uncharacterized protein MKZ38_000246 [Zalerion maritima]
MPSSYSNLRQQRAYLFVAVAFACVLVFWLSQTHGHGGVYTVARPEPQSSAPTRSPPPPAVPTEKPSSQDQDNAVKEGGDETFYASDALAAEAPVAAIIETAITPSLIPVMLHFAAVLGPAWKIILYTLEEGWRLPESQPFRRLVESHGIEIRFLPPETEFASSRSVSLFLTRPWLWEQLKSAQHVLLFQLDSMICSRASTRAEDFFEYDFVGAPIAERYGEGYNGGLSLRNPRFFLEMVQEADFEQSEAEFEDQWFYQEAKSRLLAGAEVKLPTKEIAQTFSVESIYYDTPLGYHQPSRWQEGKMDEIEAWCPEVKMLIGRRSG